ncbi:MAG: putative sphingosine kinase enzyme [Myxococcaceae bacterium]|nr:putative sphingosine kinase enzyme [Myxococcaceae bacterium]
MLRRPVQTAIIVNRNAGSMRRDPKLADRMRAVCGADAALIVTKDASDLSRVAADAAEREVGTIGIVGGDGTASATLTALWRAYGQRPLPKIAFLRGGTMNTVASSIGISHRSPVDLLRRTVAAVRDPKQLRTRARPAMVIGDRLGFLFGTGAWHGYIAESYKDGQPSRMTNATVLGRALASAAVNGETFTRILNATALSVRYAGGDWEARTYLTVAAGTVADAGFGFRPFHNALGTEQAFQILALKGNALDVLRDLPRVWFGRGFTEHTAYDTVTTWAELSAESGSFGYSVDGDVATARGTLRLELGPVFDFLRI